MTVPVSQPPMVHLSGSDKRDRHRSASPSILSPAAISSPTHPVSLGRQIHEAYHYRTAGSREYKDSESMSDETSAEYSQRGSVHDNSLQPNIYSPTFSHASHTEAGLRQYGNHRYLAPNGIRTSQPTSPYSPHHVVHSDAPMYYMPPEAEEEVENDHAIWILAWLSLLDPIYSIVGAVYALLTVGVVILLTPLRLCDSSASPQKLTIQLLSPIHAKHLRFIFAEVDDLLEYRALLLVIIYLFAPLISFGVAIAAWVSASFWVFTLIMGNPDGTERGDDGRNAVLYFRNKWALYLIKAFK